MDALSEKCTANLSEVTGGNSSLNCLHRALCGAVQPRLIGHSPRQAVQSRRGPSGHAGQAGQRLPSIIPQQLLNIPPEHVCMHADMFLTPCLLSLFAY